MKTYISLKDAEEEYSVEPEKVRELIEQGDVKAALLEGVEIGLNQAAIKYGFRSVP